MVQRTTIPTPKAKILGVGVSSTSYEEVIDIILTSLKNKSKLFLVTPNPEIVLQAEKDPKLRQALNTANVAIPDGIGLLWANLILNRGKPKLRRITGRELFEKLLFEARDLRLKIFLLGADRVVNVKSVKKIKSIYPEIEVDGVGGMAVTDEGDFVSKEIERKTLKRISELKPDLLFVAFGAPKQEKWVHRQLDKLDIGCAMVVGGTLDYFVGKAKKPPRILSILGLEWLWRLARQPARLARIVNAVLVFPLHVLISLLTGKGR